MTNRVYKAKIGNQLIYNWRWGKDIIWMGDLISVIIPAYNISKYIYECVESIRGQTYTNIEIIIIDDGSTDNTYQVCQQLAEKDNRIILLSQKNQGVTVARETGIRKAKGKYLAFVDGDDWIDQGMFENMLKQMADAELISVGVFYEKAKDCVVKLSDQFVCGSYEKASELNYIRSNMLYDQNKDILYPMSPWLFNKLYIKDKVCEVYKYLDKNLTFGEDVAFLCLYILFCKKMIITDECYYHYRYRESSASRKKDLDSLSKISDVYNNLYPIFIKYPEYDLLYQLQKWLQISVSVAVNERMGFDRRVYFPRFMADTNELSGKKIVIYGAGRAGEDIHRQLEIFRYEIVLWVDKNFEIYQEKGLSVTSPREMSSYNFDLIYIAVENKEMASEIRNELIDMEVENEKIIWNPLLKLY